jgi:hypothetical protein
MEKNSTELLREEYKKIIDDAIESGYCGSNKLWSAIYNNYGKSREAQRDIWSKIYHSTIRAWGKLDWATTCAHHGLVKISKTDLETMLETAINRNDVINTFSVCYVLGRSLRQEEKILIFKSILFSDETEIFIQPFLKRIRPNKRKAFLESVLSSYLENLLQIEHFCVIKLAKLIGRNLSEKETRIVYEMVLKDGSVFDRFPRKELVAKIGELEIEYILKELELFVKKASENSLNNSIILAEMLPEPSRSEWLIKIAALQPCDQALATLKIVKPGTDIEPTLLALLKNETDRNRVYEIIKMFPANKHSELAESFFVKGLDSRDLFSLISEDKRLNLIEKLLEECLLTGKRSTYDYPTNYVSQDDGNQLYFRIAARAINNHDSAIYKKARKEISYDWEKMKSDLFKKLTKEDLLFVLENI